MRSRGSDSARLRRSRAFCTTISASASAPPGPPPGITHTDVRGRVEATVGGRTKAFAMCDKHSISVARDVALGNPSTHVRIPGESKSW